MSDGPVGVEFTTSRVTTRFSTNLATSARCEYVNSVYGWVRQHVDSDTGCQYFSKVDIRNLCTFSDEKTSEKCGSPGGLGSGIYKGVVGSCQIMQLWYSSFLCEFQISDERCVEGGMSTSPPPSSPTTTGVSGKVVIAKQRQSKGGIGAGAIVAIFIVLMLICCIGAWCVYAYRHPTSKSGLFLIDVSSSSSPFLCKMLRSCKLFKMKEFLWTKFFKKARVDCCRVGWKDLFFSMSCEGLSFFFPRERGLRIVFSTK